MKIACAQLWVQDQEEALAFWTEKVGFEVRADVTMPEMGDFRWLTVGPPGQEDVAVVLMAVPGEPMIDGATQAQIRDLAAKGFAGTVFITTEDCRADYEALVARGVEFTEAGFRDPSGNAIRLTQVTWALSA
jgi:catechol 2,3-dioxygenase-like lactoylglutathione lyase family enzyme